TDEDPTDDGALLRVTRQVARVVVAALGPTETRERNGEGDTRRVELPTAPEAFEVRRAVLQVVHGEQHKDGPKGNYQRAKPFDHRGVTEVRHDRLDRGREHDEDHLQWVRDVQTRHLEQDDRGADDEDQSLRFKAQLRDPVKEADEPRPLRAKGGARDRKGRGPGFGSL